MFTAADQYPTLKRWVNDDPAHPFHPSRLPIGSSDAEALDELLAFLEEVAPIGLPLRRREFSTVRDDLSGLVNLRTELVIAAALARCGTTFEFRKDSPDLELSSGQFGYEVTCRIRNDILRIHGQLEDVLFHFPDLTAEIVPDGRFKFAPEHVEGIVVAVEKVAQARRGVTLDFPQAGIKIHLHHDASGRPGARVTWRDVGLDPEDAGYLAAGLRELVTRIEEKGAKTYAVPTLLVIDITRLGTFARLAAAPIQKALAESRQVVTPNGMLGVAVVRAGYLASNALEVLWATEEDGESDSAIQLLKQAASASVVGNAHLGSSA